MTAESRKSGAFVGGREERSIDMFPIGMRVLAVDDDPVCLKILENLLRRCKYHVTTTNQAIMALKMLRENKDKFDLVISDVSMPDMDGFKLLELVGLEMDIPVIMLSAYSDHELVMQGVAHGAVDYLSKPVREEELKNIWQHVVRKKNFEPKNRNEFSVEDRAQFGTGEGGQGASVGMNTDMNEKVNRKRSDHDEGEDNDGEENEDSLIQKKPRVVWSLDLHRRFVEAVNQLGLENAAPKKILALMNVEGLSRENVASHLQKYRLYLKRISNVASQQPNFVAALGSKDPSYMRYGSLDGYGDFRTLTAAESLSATSRSSYPPSGMLGRLNTLVGLGYRGIPSSGLLQPTHSQNSGGSAHYMGQLQPQRAINLSSNLLHGIPTTLDVRQLQLQSKLIGPAQMLNSEDPMAFRSANKITDPLMTASGGNNSLPIIMSNNLLLQNNRMKPAIQVGGGLHSERPVDVGPSCSGFTDQSRCNDSGHGGTVQNSYFSSSVNNAMPLTEPLHNLQPPHNRSFSSATSQVRDSQIGFCPTSVVPGNLDDSRLEVPSQMGLISGKGNTVKKNFSFGQSFGAMDSVVTASRQVDVPMTSHSDPATIPANAPQSRGETAPFGLNTRSPENYLPEQTKGQNDLPHSPLEPLDGTTDAMIKREHTDGILLDGDVKEHTDEILLDGDVKEHTDGILLDGDVK